MRLPSLPDASFDLILHDPPRFSLAGELYRALRELFRVLKPGGHVPHGRQVLPGRTDAKASGPAFVRGPSTT